MFEILWGSRSALLLSNTQTHQSLAKLEELDPLIRQVTIVSEPMLNGKETRNQNHSAQNVHAIHTLLNSLKRELDPIHSQDMELHQLWLETEWLQSNIRWDRLCLPTNWELFVFRIERGDIFRLRNYPNVVARAKEVAIALRTLVPKCK